MSVCRLLTSVYLWLCAIDRVGHGTTLPRTCFKAKFFYIAFWLYSLRLLNFLDTEALRFFNKILSQVLTFCRLVAKIKKKNLRAQLWIKYRRFLVTEGLLLCPGRTNSALSLFCFREAVDLAGHYNDALKRGKRKQGQCEGAGQQQLVVGGDSISHSVVGVGLSCCQAPAALGRIWDAHKSVSGCLQQQH